MAIKIHDACEAAAGVIATIPGLRAKGYADDKVTADEAQVTTREHDPRFTFQGRTRVVPMVARIYTKRDDPRRAQARLRGYMEPDGPTSVQAKLEDEDAWATSITPNDVTVTLIGQPFEEVLAETSVFLAVDIEFDVIF